HLVTADGAIMGTPLYMAPEMWRGDPATRSADIYALGAVLHELATGHPPHHEHAALPWQELSRVVMYEDTPPLSLTAPALDPRLAEIIERCLRRNPDE